MSLYLLLLSAVFAVAAPASSRRLPPRLATWLLSVGGVLAAAGSSASLALLAFDALAQNSMLAERAHWSDEVLHRHDPTAVSVGVAACVALAVFGCRFAQALSRRIRAVREAHALAAAGG